MWYLSDLFLLCQLEITASFIAQSGIPEPLKPSPGYGTVDGRGFEYDDVIHHLRMLCKGCYHIFHLRVDAQLFSKTETKSNLRYQKYPDTFRQGLSVDNCKHILDYIDLGKTEENCKELAKQQQALPTTVERKNSRKNK